MLYRDDLLRDWGKLSRVSDIIARMRCSNCAKKRVKSALHVAVVAIKPYKGAREVARERMAAIDRLAFDLADLKPSGRID